MSTPQPDTSSDNGAPIGWYNPDTGEWVDDEPTMAVFDEETERVNLTYDELRASQAALNRHRKVRERGLIRNKMRENREKEIAADTNELVAIATATSKIRRAVRRFERRARRG